MQETKARPLNAAVNDCLPVLFEFAFSSQPEVSSSTVTGTQITPSLTHSVGGFYSDSGCKTPTTQFTIAANEAATIGYLKPTGTTTPGTPARGSRRHVQPGGRTSFNPRRSVSHECGRFNTTPTVMQVMPGRVETRFRNNDLRTRSRLSWLNEVWARNG